MQIMLDDLKAKRSVYENAGMKESVSSIESSIILAEKLLKLEKEQSHLYATFCFKCANKNIPIIKFEDWIDLTYGGNK